MKLLNSTMKRRWTCLLLVTILLLTTFMPNGLLPRVEAAVANHVVISQIYGGGGNGGAQYLNDFIELYNPTDQNISLDGWTVQYTSVNGNSWANQIANLSGMIQSHGFYLVKLGSGGSAGVALPSENASGNYNMSASAGKVALVQGTAGITGKNDPAVRDFVGYGSANEFEGSNPALGLSNTTNLLRKANDGSDPTAAGRGNGNGWDDNENRTDFVISSPTPRNASSPHEPGDPPEEEVTPIQTLKETDADGNPTRLGNTFTIEGVATIDNGVLGTQNSNFYIQDATAGINIFGGVAHGLTIQRGDRLRITGSLIFFRGLTELQPTMVEKIGTGELPEPSPTTIAELNNFTTAEPLEGSLVRLMGKVTNLPSPDTGGNYNITIADEENHTTTLRVIAGTQIDVPTTLQLNGTYTFTGIIGQFKTNAPYTSGYQVFPRSIEDIEAYNQLTLTHEPITEAYRNTDIVFRATSLGATSIAVYYKSGSDSSYTTLPMILSSENQYSVTLAAASVPEGGFDYYIEASSDTNQIRSGSPDSPHHVVIVEDHQGPLFFEEVPINGASVENKRPGISVKMNDPSGIVLNTVQTWLDDAEVTTQASINDQQVAFTPNIDLEIGTHHVRVSAQDNLGNTNSFEWSFEVVASFTGGNHYRGSTHNHTNISHDAAGTPEAALQAAERYHYDWFAFSDHSHDIDPQLLGQDTVDHGGRPERTGGTEWQLTKQLADQYTENGQFVVFPSFEMTSTTWGHSNVFGTDNFIDRKQNSGMYQNLNNYYAWVLTYDDVAAQFNHPTMGNNTFNNFRPYDKNVDKLFTMFEVGNGSGHYSYFNAESKYYEALDLGWHIAPTFGEDNHDATWGETMRRTVIVSNELSQDALLHSMRNMRVYMVEDPNFTLDVLANGSYMGSTVDNNQLSFSIHGSDPVAESPSSSDYDFLPTNYRSDDRIAKVELITNGGQVVSSIQPMTTDFTWSPTYTVAGGQQWFVVKVTQMDGERVYSSPIWSKEEQTDVKINSLEVDGALTEGIPANLIATVGNYGTDGLANLTVSFYVDQIDSPHLIGSQPIATLASKEVRSVNATWASPIQGNHTLIAVVRAPAGVEIGDVQFFKPVQVRDPLGITVMIDASHGNENTTRDTGTYSDKLRAITRLLQNEGYNVIENQSPLTSTLLSNVKVLMITHPKNRLSTEEINAVASFVQNGGSLLLTAKSNFNNDPTLNNGLLTQLGTTIRINNDGIFDDSPTGNFWSNPLSAKHAVRLHPGLVSTYVTDRVPALDYFSGASLEGVGHQPLTDNGNLIILAKGNETTYQNNVTGGGYVYDNVSDETGGSAIPAIASDLIGNGRIIVSGMNVFNDLQLDESFEPKGNDEFSLNTVNWLAHRDTVISSIATARSFVDETPIVVEGTVTTAAGVFFDAFYLQDDTGGIMAFNDVPEGSLQVGDRVRVYGHLKTFENNRELEFNQFATDVSKIGHTDPVLPKVVSTGEANAEENQGMLLKMTGNVLSRYDANSYVIDDGTGPILIFTDGYIVNQSGPVPELQVGERLEAVGLAGKYAEGIRIRVRDTQELRKLEDNPPPGTVNITARPSATIVRPDEPFMINIDFTQVEDLYTAEFSLTYDANLSVGEVVYSPELSVHQQVYDPTSAILFHRDDHELEDGMIRSDFIITLLGVDEGYTGRGSLAIFNFTSGNEGEYDFSLSNVRLLDSNGVDITIGTITSAHVVVAQDSNGYLLTGRIMAEAFGGNSDYSTQTLVEALDQQGNLVENGTVDSSGGYSIRLPSGTYTIRVTIAGHLSSSITVLLDSDKMINFTLIAGDANGDGVIDLRDLQLVAKAFGQRAPWSNPRYSMADLNRDGEVDMSDIGYILAHFGYSNYRSSLVIK